MKRSMIIFSAAILTAVLFIGAHPMEKNQIEKVWYNQEKTSKIQIYLAKDGNFYGKIEWLDVTIDKDTGKPRTDKENPDENLRNTPLMGLLILRGFHPDATDPNLYVDGKVYDPKNGKTYCGKITYKGNTLDLRGFICSVPFLGRTATWTLAEN